MASSILIRSEDINVLVGGIARLVLFWSYFLASPAMAPLRMAASSPSGRITSHILSYESARWRQYPCVLLMSLTSLPWTTLPIACSCDVIRVWLLIFLATSAVQCSRHGQPNEHGKSWTFLSWIGMIIHWNSSLCWGKRIHRKSMAETEQMEKLPIRGWTPTTLVRAQLLAIPLVVALDALLSFMKPQKNFANCRGARIYCRVCFLAKCASTLFPSFAREVP